MIYAKENPIGLDAVIATVQSKLMQLETTWGVSIDGYPRCYPQVLDDNGTPKRGIEHFEKGKDYGNLIHAERNKFFFTAEDDEDLVGNGYETTTIQLYFILNLKECKPLLAHRADNEVRTDVKNILNTAPQIRITSTVKQIDRVFSGYDYQIGDDMQPYHAFRINLLVPQYDINQTYCN